MKPGVPATFLFLASIGCTSFSTQASKAPVWKISPGQPTYYINSVAISGDATKVVGGTFFNSYSSTEDRGNHAAANTTATSTGLYGTYCYNQAGSLLWKDEFTGYEGVYWVDISLNGGFAASGGWYSQNPYFGFVRAYDAVTGQRLLDYRTAKRVNQVVLSSDGTWLVSAADTVVLFKLVNGVYQKTAEYSPATSDTIETIAMSASGQSIVFGDYAGGIYLLSNTSGSLTVQQKFALPSGGYSHSVRMTPDGTSFAAGGSSGHIYFFDTASFVSSGQPTLSYQMPSTGSVYGVAIASDGSAFAGICNLTSPSTGGLVYYLTRSGSTASLQWTYQTAHNPNSASLCINQGLLAVADGHPDGTPGTFYLFNTANGSLRWQYTAGNMSWPIQIAAGGTGVAAGSDDSNIYYFTP
jgi:WD40 repeat protein